MNKNRLYMIIAILVVVVVAGVTLSSKQTATPPETPAQTGDPQSHPEKFAAAMVTDVGGINDESFNQSAWAGMESLTDDGIAVSFLESHKDADYAPNLEKKADEGMDIIWAVGFLMKTAVGEAAEANPEQLFALVDDFFEEGEYENIISVMFMSEQSSFLVGYAAALKTEKNHVGLVLGMESPTMDRFTYGYRAGLAYGAKETGKKIRTDYQVAEAFDDPAKGKALAQKMYSDGADIVYAVAGDTGKGIIEAAKEMNKWVIGVDLDQNHLAPENVICSGLKNVGEAVYGVTNRVRAGEDLGGTTLYMGIKEGGAGISMTGDLLGDDIRSKVFDIEEEIRSGNLYVPYDEETLDEFIKTLSN